MPQRGAGRPCAKPPAPARAAQQASGVRGEAERGLGMRQGAAEHLRGTAPRRWRESPTPRRWTRGRGSNPRRGVVGPRRFRTDKAKGNDLAARDLAVLGARQKRRKASAPRRFRVRAEGERAQRKRPRSLASGLQAERGLSSCATTASFRVARRPSATSAAGQTPGPEAEELWP